VYFTDRGVEEPDARRGIEEVSLSWLAGDLREFVDLNPEFERPSTAWQPGSPGSTDDDVISPAARWSGRSKDHIALGDSERFFPRSIQGNSFRGRGERRFRMKTDESLTPDGYPWWIPAPSAGERRSNSGAWTQGSVLSSHRRSRSHPPGLSDFTECDRCRSTVSITASPARAAADRSRCPAAPRFRRSHALRRHPGPSPTPGGRPCSQGR
jgi:hypothetical protein